MAGADADGRGGGRRAAVWLLALARRAAVWLLALAGRAAVWLLALAMMGGCSAATARDDEAASVASSLEVPPPPPSSATASGAPRAPQTATRIERVSIESAPPTTRVVLTLDGTAEPEVSLLASQRLVIDVPNTTCATVPRIVEAPGDPLVERVRTGQHGPPENKSRIVIDLRERADFSVRAQGDRIVAWLAPAAAGAAAPSAGGTDGSRILFGAESAATTDHPSSAPPAVPLEAATPAPTAEPAPTAAAEPAPPGSTTEMLPPPDAEPAPLPAAATPAVELAPPSPPPPVESPTVLPEATPAPSVGEPALADATPAPYVEATPVATEDRAATPSPLATTPPATPTLAPVVETAPTEPAAPPLAPATPVASAPVVEATQTPNSKRISIDFTEADVRTVVELIANAGGYKVLFTPDVGGTVTISLVDRPWEDALATVLRAKRLREVREDDVMLVSPAGR